LSVTREASYRRDVDPSSVSRSIFNSEYFAAVVVALDVADAPKTATELSELTRFPYGRVRDATHRLAESQIVQSWRAGKGSRGSLYFTPRPGPEWAALVALARTICEKQAEDTAEVSGDRSALES
jgi:hypothetical protein